MARHCVVPEDAQADTRRTAHADEVLQRCQHPPRVQAQTAASAAEIIDIRGVLGPSAQPGLLAAYARLEATTGAIVLDLARLDRLVGGVAPLVVLLIAARCDHRRMVAFGLNAHVRDVFALAGLDRHISVFETAEAALAAVGATARPPCLVRARA